MFDLPLHPIVVHFPSCSAHCSLSGHPSVVGHQKMAVDAEGLGTGECRGPGVHLVCDHRGAIR